MEYCFRDCKHQSQSKKYCFKFRNKLQKTYNFIKREHIGIDTSYRLKECIKSIEMKRVFKDIIIESMNIELPILETIISGSPDGLKMTIEKWFDNSKDTCIRLYMRKKLNEKIKV
jgi:hypothetical protein